MKLEEDHYRGLKGHMSGMRMHDHVCMAYTDREQQVTAIAYYIKAGLALGEKCLYVSDNDTSDFVLKILNDTGIDVEELIEQGAIEIASPEQVYMRKGYFDPDDVIAIGRSIISNALNKGFKGLRCACDMTWAKTYKITPKALLDYEAKVSCLFEDRLVSICQYNTHIFDEQTLDTLLRAHPVSVYGGNVVVNPQFAPATRQIPMPHEQSA
ncbi:MAG: MEDS domain-containing protein [Cyanobacteria bacterium SZAS-4]|nr:MEDS domain-containing protein [Cyanobacteria bacterium SZAS-4]